MSHLVKQSTFGTDESEEAKRFRRYRWGWFALAIAGAVGYVMTQGLLLPIVIRVERDPAGFQEAHGEDDEELLDDTEIDDMDL